MHTNSDTIEIDTYTITRRAIRRYAVIVPISIVEVRDGVELVVASVEKQNVTLSHAGRLECKQSSPCIRVIVVC